MDRDMVASDDESDWSFVKEMKKFRATAKHRKDFEHRLKQKLIRFGKIEEEDELPVVDSLIESAYNSQKAIEWGEKKDEKRKDKKGNPLRDTNSPTRESTFREIGKDPMISLESEEEFDVYSNSDESEQSDHSLDIMD